MNISGIRPFEAIGYYSNVNRIKGQEALANGVNAKGDYPEEQQGQPQQEPVVRPEQKENAFEFAKKYDPEATYELKGKDSDITKLDKMAELPKAHKDEALKQYQVFVGGRAKSALQTAQAPEKVLENFNL